MPDQRTPQDQPQKSEIHHATEDATSAPSNNDNVKQDKGNPTSPPPTPGDLPEHSFEELEKTFPEDVRVRRDESDVGGPIDIEMDTD
jgi:hypothetical protein